jgi:AbrB family looped-hinge helix DNA binding protein
VNAQTKLSAKGQVVIPKDVRDRLNWAEGTRLDVVESVGSVTLIPLKSRLRPRMLFPKSTIEDIMAGPKWEGPPKTVEDISGLTVQDLRHILDAQDRDEGD